jgi:hypothetical protein
MMITDDALSQSGRMMSYTEPLALEQLQPDLAVGCCNAGYFGTWFWTFSMD